jgi:hypothetical protein
MFVVVIFLWVNRAYKRHLLNAIQVQGYSKGVTQSQVVAQFTIGCLIYDMFNF